MSSTTESKQSKKMKKRKDLDKLLSGSVRGSIVNNSTNISCSGSGKRRNRRRLGETGANSSSDETASNAADPTYRHVNRFDCCSTLLL